MCLGVCSPCDEQIVCVWNLRCQLHQHDHRHYCGLDVSNDDDDIDDDDDDDDDIIITCFSRHVCRLARPFLLFSSFFKRESSGVT